MSIVIGENENNEIVLCAKQIDGTRKILNATREIIEDRKSALIELGKGRKDIYAESKK